ncbi:MAG: hypothetical protein RL419_1744 [Actinomycetota bacterium]|jgi:uncharacterized membrane protein
MTTLHVHSTSPARRLVRRAVNTALVATAVGALVYVERQTPVEQEGAGAARIPLAAFAQQPAPPRISTSWFCPGVAAGDGLSAGRVVIANPTEAEVTAAVTLLSADGQEQRQVLVPARTQKSVDVLNGRTVGVVVPIVEVIGALASVEQQSEFAAGDVTASCTTATSSTWYFADGVTLDGSSMRIMITNPFPETAVVDVAFTTVDGRRRPTSLQGLLIAPRSVRSLSMPDEGAADEQRVAVEVKTTTGKVVAARAQHYLGGGRLGYSTMLGVPQRLSKWWFAGGNTGANIVEQLVLFNPAEDDITVDAVFTGAGLSGDVANGVAAPSATTSVAVPAGEVVVVNAGNVEGLPEGVHGISVSTKDGSTFVAEHVINQRVAKSNFTAVMTGAPDELATTTWRVPSGVTPGTPRALTFVNTTVFDATVRVSAIGPGGEFPIPSLQTIPLPASGVTVIDMPLDATTGELIIESDQPIVVQRRLSRGRQLVGFSGVLALPQPGANSR